MKTQSFQASFIQALLFSWLFSVGNAFASDWVAPTEIPATQAERLTKITETTQQLANANEQQSQQLQRMILLMRYNVLLENSDASVEDLNQLIADTKQYTKTHKDDVEIYAMLGSAQSYSSVFYQDDVGKMNYYAKMGIRMLDRMKRKAPNHLGVLLQRGITYAVMPAFLNKAKFALEDLQAVKDFFADKENPQMQNMVDYYLAVALYNNDQKDAALNLWKQIAEKQVVPWNARAKAELEDKD